MISRICGWLIPHRVRSSSSANEQEITPILSAAGGMSERCMKRLIRCKANLRR